MTPRPVQDFAISETGQIYICDDDGNVFSGPYDTLEAATEALDEFEAGQNSPDEWVGHPDQTSPMTVGPEAFLED